MRETTHDAGVFAGTPSCIISLGIMSNADNKKGQR